MSQNIGNVKINDWIAHVKQTQGALIDAATMTHGQKEMCKGIIAECYQQYNC